MLDMGFTCLLLTLNLIAMSWFAISIKKAKINYLQLSLFINYVFGKPCRSIVHFVYFITICTSTWLNTIIISNGLFILWRRMENRRIRIEAPGFDQKCQKG